MQTNALKNCFYKTKRKNDFCTQKRDEKGDKKYVCTLSGKF